MIAKNAHPTGGAEENVTWLLDTVYASPGNWGTPPRKTARFEEDVKVTGSNVPYSTKVKVTLEPLIASATPR